MSLGFGATLPAGDDRGLTLIAHDGGMDFTQIDGDQMIAGCRLRGLAVLLDDVPGVAPRPLVVDQADFQKPDRVAEVFGEGDPDRWAAAPDREDERIASPPDAGVLPDGRAEPLATVGELDRGGPGLAHGPCRRARRVEALLRRV